MGHGPIAQATANLGAHHIESAQWNSSERTRQNVLRADTLTFMPNKSATPMARHQQLPYGKARPDAFIKCFPMHSDTISINPMRDRHATDAISLHPSCNFNPMHSMPAPMAGNCAGHGVRGLCSRIVFADFPKQHSTSRGPSIQPPPAGRYGTLPPREETSRKRCVVSGIGTTARLP